MKEKEVEIYSEKSLKKWNKYLDDYNNYQMLKRNPF